MTRKMLPEGGPHDPPAAPTLAAATWNVVRDPSSTSSKCAPVRVQGWSDPDVLDPTAVVDGLAQEGVEPSTGDDDVLVGKVRHWDAVGSRTQPGTGLATPPLPELSGWPSNAGKWAGVTVSRWI